MYPSVPRSIACSLGDGDRDVLQMSDVTVRAYACDLEGVRTGGRRLLRKSSATRDREGSGQADGQRQGEEHGIAFSESPSDPAHEQSGGQEQAGQGQSSV